ncbi:unnamed protein product [Peronospora destructor]|uniref:Uncharacterized protein n=1 Tax=Peronospora destructor TaxID=86335 RepID=A0AAV0VAP6_9STRA|nr:unnamed protein product [Peronospora destructor]
MSNVVVPSFFPTSIEIAGGIRWVKEHPVVATAALAAATARVTRPPLSRDRTLTLCNLSFVEFEAEGNGEIDAAVGNNELLEAALQEADGETGSPQWGWYVSTTPPEDDYQ